MAAHLQDLTEDSEGLEDERPIPLRQFAKQQVQSRSREVGLLRRPELGRNGKSQPGIPRHSLSKHRKIRKVLKAFGSSPSDHACSSRRRKNAERHQDQNIL